jgi:hypothetical protein
MKINSGGEGKPGFEPATEEDKNTKVKMLFNGSPLLNLNDKVILFGKVTTTHMYPITEEYYNIVGVYDGRFVVKGGEVERYGSTNLNVSEENLRAKIKDAFKSKNK